MGENMKPKLKRTMSLGILKEYMSELIKMIIVEVNIDIKTPRSVSLELLSSTVDCTLDANILGLESKNAKYAIDNTAEMNGRYFTSLYVNILLFIFLIS